MKLVDPDGREIVIKDGEQTYYYRNGHVYLSKKHGALPMDNKLGKEASKIKKNLDIMSKDKAGAKVINRLVGIRNKLILLQQMQVRETEVTTTLVKRCLLLAVRLII